MTCEEAILLISGRLDAENTAEEEALLNDHLASCPSCSSLWQQLRTIDRDLQGLQEEVPADLHADIMDEVRKQARRRRVRALYPALTAAAVALVIGLGVRDLPKEAAAPQEARFVETVGTTDSDCAVEESCSLFVSDEADLAEVYQADVVVMHSVLEELQDHPYETLEDGSRLYRLGDKDGAKKLSQSYDLELYQPQGEPAADVSYAWLQP